MGILSQGQAYGLNKGDKMGTDSGKFYDAADGKRLTGTCETGRRQVIMGVERNSDVIISI